MDSPPPDHMPQRNGGGIKDGPAGRQPLADPLLQLRSFMKTESTVSRAKIRPESSRQRKDILSDCQVSLQEELTGGKKALPGSVSLFPAGQRGIRRQRDAGRDIIQNRPPQDLDPFFSANDFRQIFQPIGMGMAIAVG